MHMLCVHCAVCITQHANGACAPRRHRSTRRWPRRPATLSTGSRCRARKTTALGTGVTALCKGAMVPRTASTDTVAPSTATPRRACATCGCRAAASYSHATGQRRVLMRGKSRFIPTVPHSSDARRGKFAHIRHGTLGRVAAYAAAAAAARRFALGTGQGVVSLLRCSRGALHLA